MTSARDGVPLMVVTVVVVSHSGADSGIRFWKNDFSPTPFGYRSSSTGRSWSVPHDRRADRHVVLGEVELGDPELREHHLVRTGDGHGLAVGDALDGFAMIFLGHGARLMQSGPTLELQRGLG